MKYPKTNGAIPGFPLFFEKVFEKSDTFKLS